MCSHTEAHYYKFGLFIMLEYYNHVFSWNYMKVDQIDLWVSFLVNKVISQSHFIIRRVNVLAIWLRTGILYGECAFLKESWIHFTHLSQTNFESSKMSPSHPLSTGRSLPTCYIGLLLTKLQLSLLLFMEWRCLYDRKPIPYNTSLLSALTFATQPIQLLITTSTFLLPVLISGK